jgi:SAM-dependent methyltransferase
MANDVPFFPDRFKSAAEFYLSGRPAYPKLLIKRVAQAAGLNHSHQVLDLGTGPGLLAVNFAPYAGGVAAVDPSSEMLAAAAENARRENVRIKFLQGSSFDLTPEFLGPDFARLRLVSIGRAFHWMDRAATLKTLDKIVEPDGVIALFSDSYPDVPENSWLKEFDEIIDGYSTGDPAKPLTRGALKHEAVLLESRFSALETISVIEKRKTPVERFVDRALSFGATWHGRPGSRLEDLPNEVRERLEKYAVNGVISEVTEGKALIARRP